MSELSFEDKVGLLSRLVSEALLDQRGRPPGRHPAPMTPEFAARGSQTHWLDALCDALRGTEALEVLDEVLYSWKDDRE